MCVRQCLQRPDSRPPTMAFADFCAITPGVNAGRAARRVEGRCRFLRSGRAARPGAGYLVSRVNRFRVVLQSQRTADAAQSALQAASGRQARPFARRKQSPGLFASGLSPGKNANCRCTSAAFPVGCVPVGFAAMCQLASHPSALTMRFLSVASHLLHSGFLQTTPRGAALAVGSWLSCSR